MLEPLFDLNHTLAGSLLGEETLPYRALPLLADYIYSLLSSLGDDFIISDGIAVHRSAVISPEATLMPPLIVSEGAELRKGAFIRGSAIIGRNAVIGNSVEVKNSVIFDSAEIPHLSYIGDSIIGYKAHFGAGAMTSNVRADKHAVRIRIGSEVIETGLPKLGALVGDRAEIGCNAVLNPGTVIGRDAMVYPLTPVRGFLPPCSIMKNDGAIISRRKEWS